MKAMIFAAGLGTRLFPLTQSKPKALVELNGKTLLEITIRKLLSFGYTEIVVNVHHHASLVVEYLEKNNGFGARICISDESDLLLDTGGGLKKAGEFLSGTEPFIIHNVDILSDINLSEMRNQHLAAMDGRLATLFVNGRESSRAFLVNDENRLCGWRNSKTGETRIPVPSTKLQPVSFCGIHIIEPAIFQKIEMDGVFSMVDLYLALCMTNNIACWKNDTVKWMDVGTIENLKQAEKMFF
jgi:N-acetyl-alpha-D-muramate 1-phosphate uridylyltransferase